ncbi:F-box/kelch-repeat protein At1g57790-like [Ananas comosus]|uniref:F-box/kelch-repeat protein At1g57790-like n=1 Tax=Ananas comosus TaxID=4615 RepID=A0A6P5EY44_ANACO|nr:F-box/kelch-repeat protein At1g57790-like [Ananas comosus]
MATRRRCSAPCRWYRTESGRLTSRRESLWSRFLPELLEKVSDHLPVRDLIVFRQVCRSWRAAPSGRALITKFSKNHRWFLVYGRDGRAESSNHACYFKDPCYPDHWCTVVLPDLRGATCLVSKGGWLLAHRDRSLFFCNPLTFERIDIPGYPKTEVNERMCIFLSSPTAPDCIVAVLRCVDSSKLEVDSCCVGEPSWTTRLVETNCVWSNEKKLARICNCSDHDPGNCVWRKAVFIADAHVSVAYDLATGRVFSWSGGSSDMRSNSGRSKFEVRTESSLLPSGTVMVFELLICPFVRVKGELIDEEVAVVTRDQGPQKQMDKTWQEKLKLKLLLF